MTALYTMKQLSHSLNVQFTSGIYILRGMLINWRLLKWHSGKESACQCGRHRFNPWVWKIPWRRKWQPTPVFLPGKFHEQRNLVGYSP